MGSSQDSTFIVCELEDFAGKCLHHRIGPNPFKLHYHRTEVARDPVNAEHPYLPLRKKYYSANYTVEGLEDKDGSKLDPIADED